MNSHHGLALSPPSWGTSRRFPLGGLALVALWGLLWSLFLGTVGAPRAGQAERPELVLAGHAMPAGDGR